MPEQENENLKRLYGNMPKFFPGFNLTYDQFRTDMQSEDNLKRLYDNLNKNVQGFNVPYAKFQVDMGYSGEVKTPTDLPVVSETELGVQKPIEPAKTGWGGIPILSQDQKELLAKHDIDTAAVQRPTTGTFVGDIGERMAASILDLPNGIMKAIEFRTAFEAAADGVKPAPMEEINKMAQETGIPSEFLRKAYDFQSGKSMDFWFDLARESETYKKNAALVEKLMERSDRYDGESITELWKEDPTKAVGQALLSGAESLPQSVTAALAGPVGLMGLGMLSAGEQYDQLDERLDMTETSKLVNATLNGAFEVLTEYFGSYQFTKLIKDIFKQSGKEVGEQVVKEITQNFFQKAWKNSGIYFAPIGEGIEEVANQFASNVVAVYTGEDVNRQFTDGLWDAFGAGAGGGTFFSAVGVPGQIYNNSRLRAETNKARSIINYGLQGSEMWSQSQMQKDYREKTGKVTVAVDNDNNVFEVLGRTPNDEIYGYTPQGEKIAVGADQIKDYAQLDTQEFNNIISNRKIEKPFVDNLQKETLKNKEIQKINDFISQASHVENGEMIRVQHNNGNYYYIRSGDIDNPSPLKPLIGVSMEDPDDRVLIDASQIKGIERSSIEDYRTQNIFSATGEVEKASEQLRFNQGEIAKNTNVIINGKKGVVIDASDIETGLGIEYDDGTSDFIKPAQYDDIEIGPKTEPTITPEREERIIQVDEKAMVKTFRNPDGSYTVGDVIKDEKEAQKMVAKLESRYPNSVFEVVNEIDPADIFAENRIKIIARNRNEIQETEPIEQEVATQEVSEGQEAVGGLQGAIPTRTATEEEITPPVQEEIEPTPEEVSPLDQQRQQLQERGFKADEAFMSGEQVKRAIVPDSEKQFALDVVNAMQDPNSIYDLPAFVGLDDAITIANDVQSGNITPVTQEFLNYLENSYKSRILSEQGMEIDELEEEVAIANLRALDTDLTEFIPDDLARIAGESETIDDFRRKLSTNQLQRLESYVTEQIQTRAERGTEIDQRTEDDRQDVDGRRREEGITEPTERATRQQEEVEPEKVTQPYTPRKEILKKFQDRINIFPKDSHEGIIQIQDDLVDMYPYRSEVRRSRVSGDDTIFLVVGASKSEENSFYIVNEQGDIYLVPNFSLFPVGKQDIKEQIEEAEKEVNTFPTEAQKEAGNYKMGHVVVQGLEVTIETPKGAIRSGKDSDGETWEQRMNNTYGYFKRTKGKDGDQIDVFLGEDLDSDKVYIVDQVDPDTKKFDEHKVMLGFLTEDEAREAYLSNYEENWQGLGNITEINIDDFKTWLGTGTRKLKAFADYKSVPTPEETFTLTEPIVETKHTKTGEDLYVVKLTKKVNWDQLKKIAARNKGGWSRFTRGFNFKTREKAQDFQKEVEQEFKAETVSEFLEQPKVQPTKEITPPEEKPSETTVGEVLFGESERKEKPESLTKPEKITKFAERKPDETEGDYTEQEREALKELYPGQQPGFVSERRGLGQVLSGEGREPSPTDTRSSKSRVELQRGERNGVGATDRDDLNTANYSIPRTYKPPQTFSKATNFENNIEALKVLVKLKKTGKLPTKAEKEKLFKYVGWGGIKDILNPYSYTLTDTDRNRIKTATDLIKELDPTGQLKIMEAVKSSVASAHFTSVDVIKGIYSILGKSGYVHGNILEPSMGTGHFFGAMPIEMKKNSFLTGVELDYITGNIAQYLYPDADIKVTGLQDANLSNNYYDLALGNVPFGDVKIYDPAWKNNANPIYKIAQNRIHNYFLVKMMELTKPGGILAFITSSGILDSKGNEVMRNYIYDNAEFLGALRLPNTAFKANANTEVTADILFLRKFKDGEIKEQKNNFVELKSKKLPHKDTGEKFNVFYNEYFHDNPDMMLGIARTGGLYEAGRFTLEEKPGKDLLSEIRRKGKKIISGPVIKTINTPVETNERLIKEYEGIDKDFVRHGNIVLQDGKLGRINVEKTTYEQKVKFVEQKFNAPKGRIVDFIRLRNTLSELMFNELKGSSPEALEPLRSKLNTEYDTYVKKHGRLRDKNNTFIDDDIDGYTVFSLEKYDKDKKFVGKADIFTKQTINPIVRIETVETPEQALLVSLDEYGYIAPERMEELLGSDWLMQVEDQVFELPDARNQYVTSEEYLTGNVREKLKQAEIAARSNPKFQKNVEALQAAVPQDIPPSLIDIRIGARWVTLDTYTKFVRKIFNTENVEILYNKGADRFYASGNRWSMSGLSKAYAAGGREGVEILEAALNDNPIKIYYKDSDGNSIFDAKATAQVETMMQKIKGEFDTWLRGEPEQLEKLGRIYNDTFNSTVKRQYNGDHMTFPGLMGVTLRKQQKDAAWMVLQNNGGVVDHIVGAGKTLVMITAAQEMRRTGIAKKPMILAYKSTVPQIAEEYKAKYPFAKILAPNENQFSAKNRKKVLAQIATNDWDCVILSHNQYVMLEHDDRVVQQVLGEALEQIDASIVSLYGLEDQSQMTNRQIRGLQKRRDNLEARIKKQLDRKIDREFTFEKLGVDHLFVDESHLFKNLEFTTAHSSVAGLGTPQGNQKTQALLMGIRSLQTLHNGDKGTTFLSGTPISNSMVELYLILRYLRPSVLKKLGLDTFDSWASVFSERSTDIEFSVTGELKQKDRFRRFTNVPELSILYSEIADVRNDSNLKLPKPKAEIELVNLKPSELQKDYTNQIINFAQTGVGVSLGIASTDNNRKAKMLLATNLSAKMSMDIRLLDDTNPSEDSSKINASAERIAEIYRESSKHKGVQLVFSDIGTPSAKFNVYNELKRTLVEDYNIPADEIQFIHDYDNRTKREKLFNQVNNGEVRILLGSTDKLGTGNNVQERIVAMHHLDVPWKPSAFEQRNGRGVRQGNIIAERFYNNKVKIYVYALERSLDAYKYQLLETKQRFITQLKDGSITDRIIDEGTDGEGGASFAEFVAILSGNPVIMHKAKADQKVHKLTLERRTHEESVYNAKKELARTNREIAKNKEFVEAATKDHKYMIEKGLKKDKSGKLIYEFVVNGKKYTKPKEAGAAILRQVELNKNRIATQPGIIEHRAIIKGINASAYGLELQVSMNAFEDYYYSFIGPSGHYYLYNPLSTDPTHAGTILTKVVNYLEDQIEKSPGVLKRLESNIKPLEEKISAVWPKEKEFNDALEEQQRLQYELEGLKDQETKPDEEIDESDEFDDNIQLKIKPIYSNVEKAIKFIKQEKATPEQWKKMLIKNGAKETELEWMEFDKAFGPGRETAGELDQYIFGKKSITKEEVQKWIDENKIEIQEVIKGGTAIDELETEINKTLDRSGYYVSNDLEVEILENDQFKINGKIYESLEDGLKDIFRDATRYAQYTLPGGESYRELLLMLPEEPIKKPYEQWLKENFYGKDRPEARELYKQQVEPNSPFYKSRHYNEPNILAHVRFDERIDKDGNRILFIEELQSDWAQEGRAEGFITPEIKEEYKKRNYYPTNNPLVADMPFKLTNQWLGLVFKRLVHYAAENGYDSIAWTTGAQQADRYDLSKHVDNIRVERGSDKKSWEYRLVITEKSGKVGTHLIFKERELSNLVGKDLANKIIGDNIEVYEEKTYSGLDLQVGGEGLKAFYDQIMPTYANKFGKKFKARAVETEIDISGGKPTEYKDFGEWLENKDENFVKVHSFDLTDELKETALQGFPMYNIKSPRSIEDVDEIIKTKKQSEYKQYIKNIADTLSETLNTKIIAVDTENDLPERLLKGLEEKGFTGDVEKVTGIHDPATGEIYLLTDYIDTTDEAKEIILHEVIAHKGMKALLGNRYKRVLSDVYNSMSSFDVKRLSGLYGTNNPYTIASEYIAEHAEQDVHPYFIQRAIAAIKDFIRKIFGLKYSSADIYYLLMKARRNLVKSSRVPDHSSDFDEKLMFKIKPGKGLTDLAREAIERKPRESSIKTAWNQIRQALQDRDLPIKTLEDEVRSRGGRISDKARAYRDKNLSYGRIETMWEDFRKEYMKPIYDATAYLQKQGMEEKDVMAYMIAKHAPERNQEQRDQRFETFLVNNPDATFEEKNEYYESLKTQDYSGVMVLDKGGEYKNTPDQFAKDLVQEYEKKYDTANFWAPVKSATEYVLKRWLDGKQIDKEQYDKYKRGYRYYVPLRGWYQAAQKYLDYHYGYGKEASLQHAEGRKSLPDNPLIYIEQAAFQSIGEQVTNEINLAMMNLILDNYEGNEDLFRVQKIYYMLNPLTGEYVPTLEVPTPEMFREGLARMEVYGEHLKLRKPGQAYEHEVWVNTDTGTYTMIFPEEWLPVAQSLNNHNDLVKMFWLTKAFEAERINDTLLMRGLASFTNTLKALFTSWNIVFPVTNLMRDWPEALTHIAVSKTPGQGVDFAKFLFKDSFKVVATYLYNNKNFDPKGNDLHQMFQEFREDGGQTGFTHSKTPEELEKSIGKEIKKAKQTFHVGHLTDQLARFSQLFEDASRFAAYVSARKRGETRKNAAALAKEATVNFNRKGKLSKAFDSVYAFFNVAIQSAQKNFYLAKHYPKRFATASAAWMLIGGLTAELNRFFDDDEEYEQVSDWVRQNYMLIPLFNGKYLRIPLPQFWRSFYSFGVLISDVAHNKKKGGEAIGEGAVNLVASLSPIDPGGFKVNGEWSAGPLVPTIYKPVYELKTNRNFLGGMIYKEAFTKELEQDLASSKMHKANVNPIIKFMTDALFTLGGGDPESDKVYYREDGKNKRVSPLFDINPSKVEHLIKSYTGGTGGFVTDLVTTLSQAVTPEETIDADNIPFVNRFIRKYPEKKWNQIREYYEYKDKLAEHEKVMKLYKNKPEYIEMRRDTEYQVYKSIIDPAERRLKQYKEYFDRDKITLEKYLELRSGVIEKAVKQINDKKKKNIIIGGLLRDYQEQLDMAKQSGSKVMIDRIQAKMDKLNIA